jgi:hypothetical protein
MYSVLRESVCVSILAAKDHIEFNLLTRVSERSCRLYRR